VGGPGGLEAFGLSADAAEGLIMRARVAMGWIEPEPDVVEEEIEAEYDEGDAAMAAAEAEV
jgi:N utilization substance protein A